MNMLDRIMARVTPAENGCLLWAGARRTKGYGVVQRGRRGEGTEPVHRATWEHANGPVPDGHELGNLCGARHCVNPAHWTPRTRSESITAAIERGTRTYDRMPSGPANGAWVGNKASYHAIHARLQRARGRAKEHVCVDCSAPAKQWSLDRSAAFVKHWNGIPYSTDIDEYEPRCVSCHKLYDLAAIGAAA